MNKDDLKVVLTLLKLDGTRPWLNTVSLKECWYAHEDRHRNYGVGACSGEKNVLVGDEFTKKTSYIIVCEAHMKRLLGSARGWRRYE